MSLSCAMGVEVASWVFVGQHLIFVNSSLVYEGKCGSSFLAKEHNYGIFISLQAQNRDKPWTV